MHALLLLSLARAADPRVDAGLHLGDGAWVARGGSWESTTASLRFDHGFAFPVLHGGAAVGLVFVGEAEHRLHPGERSDALLHALERELGVRATLDAAGDWDLPVSEAWGLGAVAARPVGWEPVGYGEGEGQAAASVLVVDERELAAARRRAAELVRDRRLDLDQAGYPLAATLEVGPNPSWGFFEARTALPLGGLAGAASAAEDPWITTLLDDVALDGGRRAATVALGARFVEKLSGF